MPTMTIQTGDKLPDATFVKVTESGPEQVSTADYFKGRKRRALLGSRRLHPDLLGQAPAGLSSTRRAN
jgi:hypothetical protein